MLSQTVNTITTATAVGSSANPSIAGGSVTYTATVTPVPDGGTVAFSDDGTTITGCEAQPVDGTGAATCSLTYASPTATTSSPSTAGTRPTPPPRRPP